MNRLVLVMQFPTPMRYQSWWFTEFPREMRQYFDQVIVLGKDYIESLNKIEKGNIENFSPVRSAIKFEMVQIEEYLDIIQDDDYLFIADISFPGLFINTLYHKRPFKCFSYCHAGAKNSFDYFSNSKDSKFQVESGHSKLFEAIFVGSKYHQNKLGWTNTLVTGLPHPPVLKPQNLERNKDIVSVCRPSIQKVNKRTEKFVRQNFGEIIRGEFRTWENYSYFLSSSKILLISSKEDTFNYTILDAIECGCIPIAPNALCFPEILPEEYLYTNKEHLREIIQNILDGKLGVPEILCKELVDDFYENITDIMLENL